MEAEPPSVLAMCPIPSTSQGDSVTPSDKGSFLSLFVSAYILLFFPPKVFVLRERSLLSLFVLILYLKDIWSYILLPVDSIAKGRFSPIRHL